MTDAAQIDLRTRIDLRSRMRNCPLRPPGRGSLFWIALLCFFFVGTGLAHAQRAASVALSASAPGANQDFTPDEALLPVARHGMFLLMNGDADGAMRVFQGIEHDHPESPLGYLFEADATWWKIYLTTGNLIDPDVFDVVSKATSPYDGVFVSQVRQAIQRADARVHAQQELARSLLDEGMAYGLLARYYGLRDNDLPTARAGKRMRALLLRALQLDPKLTDAYLGVGIYNYFVDTLPAIVKLLKFFIGLPSGSRAVGLQQLELAAQHGDLLRGEAQFYLAKDFSRGNERQYSRSLELFHQLASEYPANPLWTLVEGSLQIRLGHRQAGRDLYQQAVEKSAGLNTAEGGALHAQSQQALSRLGG